jgi:3-hydroxyacyl-CoA dehydrogenase/enoyl-CoA hydratase/3-hydroxybutyryl-CoA epimerase
VDGPLVQGVRVTPTQQRPGPAVGVVGAGTLGLTVAHAALAAGSPVVVLVRDRSGDGAAVRRRWEAVAGSLQREVTRGAISEAAAATLLDDLQVTSDPSRLADVDVVVEAVPEDLAAKRAALATIETHVSPTCLIASATSSIPASWLAARARHPERVVVAHYVWPAHRMPLVEVALHDGTSERARAALEDLLATQGKTGIRVADRPGFLITRALLAYWDEAVRLVAGGLEPVMIDQALETFGFPLGPLRMMDRAGLTTAAAVHEQLMSAEGHLFTALSRLRAVTNAGLPGFYAHRDTGRVPIPAAAAALRGVVPSLGRYARLGPESVIDRVVGALGHEVDCAVRSGVVASWSVAGRAIDLAYGFPRRHGGLQTWWSSRSRTRSLLPTAV